MIKRKSLGASSQSIKNCITSGNMELDDERLRRAMTPTLNGQTAIIRTERGLVIAGTRITLYDVMEYIIAQYPPKFICAMLNLTIEQLNAALSYIEAHRGEVEAEYQQVVKEGEELRQYYEEQNRALIARISAKPPKPGMEAVWEKLQAQKAKHQAQLKTQA